MHAVHLPVRQHINDKYHHYQKQKQMFYFKRLLFKKKKRSLLGWVVCWLYVCCLVSTLAFPLSAEDSESLFGSFAHQPWWLSSGEGATSYTFQYKGSCLRKETKQTQTVSSVKPTLKKNRCTFYCIVRATCRLISLQKGKPVYNLGIHSPVRRQKGTLKFRHFN